MPLWRIPLLLYAKIKFSSFFLLLSKALHPDHHTDHLHESECVRGSGNALYAQGLRHHLPPGAQCTEAEAEL